ncbi:hypothetical protein BaRGS_00030973 [Batillaria attramentaria]|uniref:Uncharacterized protein n=1 Tax=Batillaria attramentaria TaxID=370345 RepID=A0ABD0JT32_9CAEN
MILSPTTQILQDKPFGYTSTRSLGQVTSARTALVKFTLTTVHTDGKGQDTLHVNQLEQLLPNNSSPFKSKSVYTIQNTDTQQIKVLR